jgi:DNA-binding MarR family transcriptional regulator
LTSAVLVERASTFLFAVKEFGDVATRAINERVGEEYSGNVVVATLGALAHGDVQRPRDLESMTGASSATVARTLDLLEQRGNIVRLAHADPDDGRATLLQLTEQGRQVEREIVWAVVSSLDDIRESLRTATDLLAPIDDPAHRRRRGAQSSVSEETVIVALGRIGGILTEILTSALDDLEVTAALTLCLLHRSDGPIRPITVSTLFGLTTGATSKLIDRMETAGFVQRTYGRIAEDRRGVEVSSTTIGDSRLALIATKIFDRSTEIAHAFRLFEDLDDELVASRLS